MNLDLRAPGGDRTWIAAAALLVGCSGVGFGLARAAPLEWSTGAVCLVCGAGLWLKRPWARWAMAGFLLLQATASVWLLVAEGLTWMTVLAAVGLPFFAWFTWHAFRPEPASEAKDQPMTSLVWLLREPRYLEASVLAQIAGNAWGGRYAAGEGEVEEDHQAGFVVGQSPLFLVNSPQGVFAINNFSTRYFAADTAEVADATVEMRLRKAILEHQAWLSVDLMQVADPNVKPEALYPQIARLMAELAGPDCLALFQPATGRINVYEPDLEAKLRGPNPLEEFAQPQHVPVISVADDDPRMNAAVAEARRRWPEFVAAFKQRRPDQQFTVKAPITAGGHTEFIWVEVDGLGGDCIFGKLGNDPVDLGGLKCGDAVEAPVSDLNDWCYTNGDERVGMFTWPIFEQIMAEHRNKPDR